jgi:hypothetical protein
MVTWPQDRRRPGDQGLTDPAPIASDDEAEQQPDPADSHEWVGAALLPLTTAQARTVELRTAVILAVKTRVPVLDVYCKGCRQVFEDCCEKHCPAADPKANEHLRGGPIGERKKRGPMIKHPDEPVEVDEVDVDSYTGEVATG